MLEQNTRRFPPQWTVEHTRDILGNGPLRLTTTSCLERWRSLQ